MSKSVFGLGPLARKNGACQGMSAIVSAFMERVEFVPQGKRASKDIVEDQVTAMMKEYRRGCHGAKTRIFGYRNLQELCAANREFFLEKAIWNNADIAVNEIGNVLIDFLYTRDKAITTPKNRRDMHRAIQKFRYWLKMGRKPLMLVYSHVLSVLAVEDRKSQVGTPQVVLWLYDPNDNRIYPDEVNIDVDGLPTRGQRKFWDVTPNRGCH